MTAEPMPVKFGLQLWSQHTDWPSFRDAALAAEAERLGLGLDVGPPAGDLRPVGAADLRGLERPGRRSAPITTRVRLGLMVGANTFRNPGVTAKLATTLDHVSSGRAVLGIGGAWFEREHEAFGIDFGASLGERLDWLDEAVMLMRRLLDGERVDHEGRATRCTTRCASRGPSRRTCRSSSAAADRGRHSAPSRERADGWNTSGTSRRSPTP